MSLERAQNEFIDYLYAPKPGAEQQEQVRSYFLDPAYPDPHGGLKVYRSNLLFGIIGAMSESYPMTKVLLGENNFNFFARLFLYAHPSTNSDLIQYGDGFGEFLDSRDELKTLPFIADVARLEWALERVFYSKPEPSFLGEAPSDWQNVAPTLKTSIRIVTNHYRVREAWLGFLEKGEEGINAEQFRPETEHLVIWSDEGAPRVTPVSEALARWVEGVLLGYSSQTIAREYGLTPEAVIGSYQFALQQGWISQK